MHFWIYNIQCFSICLLLIDKSYRTLTCEFNYDIWKVHNFYQNASCSTFSIHKIVANNNYETRQNWCEFGVLLHRNTILNLAQTEYFHLFISRHLCWQCLGWHRKGQNIDVNCSCWHENIPSVAQNRYTTEQTVFVEKWISYNEKLNLVKKQYYNT